MPIDKGSCAMRAARLRFFRIALPAHSFYRDVTAVPPWPLHLPKPPAAVGDEKMASTCVRQLRHPDAQPGYTRSANFGGHPRRDPAAGLAVHLRDCGSSSGGGFGWYYS